MPSVPVIVVIIVPVTIVVVAMGGGDGIFGVLVGLGGAQAIPEFAGPTHHSFELG
jgi:hypothetical protein